MWHTDLWHQQCHAITQFPLGLIEYSDSDSILCYYTLLSFSCWLAWSLLMSRTEFSVRGMGERRDVSRGVGLMLYWTLAVPFTEKNLEVGGALLRTRKKKSTIWWQVFYTTQTYCIKHEVHFKKRIFFSMYIWGSALTYTDKPQALVTVISVCLETDLINWTSHILVISVAVRAFYTNFSWGTRNMIILYHTRLQRVFFNPCVICLFSNRRHWNNWKSWSGKAETTT